MNANTLFRAIWSRKLRFVAVFFVIFTLTYTTLYVMDFLPETPGTEEVRPTATSEGVDLAPEELDVLESASDQELSISITQTATSDSEQESNKESNISANQTVIPTAIHIEKLDKTIEVLNPASRTIADLDTALLDGVVRHPDSATLNQEGNVFILGHSSYLPNVMNENYQAFNGIQNLEWGDTIELYGGDKTYIYRVEKVYKAKASEVTVPIANTGNMLTIATCNSFGSTDDRYIVEATQQMVRSS